MRIALFLTIENRINRSGVYLVQNLLKTKYSQQILNQAIIDRKKAYQIRQTWQKTLLKLHQLGWLIQVYSEKYPESMLQDFLQTNQKKMQFVYIDKNIFEQVLTAKVKILQPEPTRSLLKKIKNPTSSFTGKQVKEARLAKGWTQQQLADAIWVSRTTISLIENEKQPLTPSLIRDLQIHLNL